MKQRNLIAVCVLAAGLLAACGGGDTYVAPTPPPLTGLAAAVVSPEAYTQYGIAQAASTSETAEPVSLDVVVTPPTSETAEPVSL